jgi:probable rRNA maturation factor
VQVDVSVEVEDADDGLTRWLTDQARRAALAAGVERASLSVALVNDVRMMQLHHQFSGDVATTDVLTFDLHEDPRSLEGEIVVCYDEACRQARAHGHTAEDEALLYVVHGLLHLMGYDDHDPAEAAKMHEREDELLTAIGVGPVYAPSRAASGEL